MPETEHGFAKARRCWRHCGSRRQAGRGVGGHDQQDLGGSSIEGYAVASALERLYVQPGGMIGLTGIAIEDAFRTRVLRQDWHEDPPYSGGKATRP
ncbi:MAG: hypothetical protein R3D03_08145 [Geminicoccaceae bacterium]